MQGNQQDRENLMRGVHLLNVLYLSNQARKDPLPNSEFYSKGVSQQADLAHEYIVWHRLLVSSFMQYRPHTSAELWSIISSYSSHPSWQSMHPPLIPAAQIQNVILASGVDAYICCLMPQDFFLTDVL